MITCKNCTFSDPSAFRGFKSELRFIRVINCISHDEHKIFYCSLDCYVEDMLKREFYKKGDDSEADIALFEEYKSKNDSRIRNDLLACPAIQDFFKRNNLQEVKPFDVEDEIKDWADC